MKTKSGEKVDFKHNFREYLSYLKNYKFLIFLLFFVVLLSEMKSITDRYLFKIIVDKGAEFSAGTLAAINFSKLLMIIGGIYIGIL